MTGNIIKKAVINNGNLLDYLKRKYNVDNIQKCIQTNQISGVEPLLQDDYGADNDCTLTSITTILTQFCDKTPEEIYPIVEKYGLKYFYTGEKGTNPLVMRTIMNLAAQELGIKKRAVVRYGKNVSFNFAGIKQHIDAGRLIMLSIFNDGRDYYKDHSVTIVGYSEYKVDKSRKAKMIKIYDNWHKEITYVDYDLLHLFSSLHYYN